MHAPATSVLAAGIEFGPVSEWVAGIGTVVAVVVALTFSLRAEREQRNSRLAAVYAWAEVAADPEHTGTLRIINNTESPIYDWRITVSWDGQDGAQKQAQTGFSDYGLLPPGRHAFTFSDDGTLPSNDASLRVQLEFRDAQDRAWKRLSSGRLEKN